MFAPPPAQQKNRRDKTPGSVSPRRFTCFEQGFMLKRYPTISKLTLARRAIKWVARGAGAPQRERIKALGLKLGNELKTSLDTRHPMRITDKEGEVAIKAGETKLIELPKAVLAIQWQGGDFKPESIEDIEPFDYLLVEWKSDGHVTWTCYRPPSADHTGIDTRRQH
jgi:hypothetical protein